MGDKTKVKGEVRAKEKEVYKNWTRPNIFVEFLNKSPTGFAHFHPDRAKKKTEDTEGRTEIDC